MFSMSEIRKEGIPYGPYKPSPFDRNNIRFTTGIILVVGALLGGTILSEKNKEKSAERCVSALVGHKIDLEIENDGDIVEVDKSQRDAGDKLGRLILACTENDNKVEDARASLVASN